MNIIPSNSIVVNAKGDLISGSYSAVALGQPSDSTNPIALLSLQPNGDIDRIITVDGIEQSAVTVGTWVDTDGSDDTPVNPAPWDGVSGYEISWATPTVVLNGPGAVVSPTTAQSYTAWSGSYDFSVQSSTENIRRWTVNIRKTGLPATEVSIILEVTASIAF